MSQLTNGVQSMNLTDTTSVQATQGPLASGDVQSVSSGDHVSTNAPSKLDGAQDDVDLPLQESTICERLVSYLQEYSTNTQMHGSGSLDPRVQPRTLLRILTDATEAVRFHAKWFSEPGLTNLLRVALETASMSSSSAEIHAAISLVNTVGIYSFLPKASLGQCLRFISLTYYNATRAHKTKSLAKETKNTLLHILESHLGGQAVVAILEMINSRDPDYLISRTGHAQTAGALMVISQKLLLKEDVRNSVPTPDMLDLLEALRGPAAHGNESLREQIMDIVSLLLLDDYTVKEINTQCCWDIVLDIIGPCVAEARTTNSARAVVDGLVACTLYFEARQLPHVALLVTKVDRPLPPRLSHELVASYSELVVRHEDHQSYQTLLSHITKSRKYQNELRDITAKITSAFAICDDQPLLRAIAKTLHQCIANPETTQAAAAVILDASMEMFLNVLERGFEDEASALFELICTAAKTSAYAMRFLLTMRADVKKSIYFEISVGGKARALAFNISSLEFQLWERLVLGVAEDPSEWSPYWSVVDGLSSCLSNHALFESRVPFIKRLAALFCGQLASGTYQEPPAYTELTKSCVAARLVGILTAIVTYHRPLSKQTLLEVASTCLNMAGYRDHVVGIACVHGLMVCCYEIPNLMSSYMEDVIDKMSKMVTQKYLAIHVLQFLADLSRLPDLFRNFQSHDYKKIFGVCGSYLQSIRGSAALASRHRAPVRGERERRTSEGPETLSQYVYALAHHVITFWYLALKPHDRREVKEYVTCCLRYSTPDDKVVIEDHAVVTMDLMDRVDAEEISAVPNTSFHEIDGRTVVQHTLVGLLLITTETSMKTNKTIITVRRASGTSRLVLGEFTMAPRTMHAIVTLECTADAPLHIIPIDPDGEVYGKILIPGPQSILGAKGMVKLADDDPAFKREIQSFDRMSAMDSHKVGVIYVGEGQTAELEILQNSVGSPDYVDFVLGLGTLTELRNATFNTQGLDRADDMDGKHAIVWHNDITELVFHVTTLMPTQKDINVNMANKKRHIGNDFVNIIFNNSGTAFAFDTFPSQFNYVYIVIVPSARTSYLQSRIMASSTDHERFYTVQLLTRPDLPVVSSASEPKVISGTSLPDYVRNLALNHCVLALMCAAGHDAGEYPSSWRSRLQHLRRLHERFGGGKA